MKYKIQFVLFGLFLNIIFISCKKKNPNYEYESLEVIDIEIEKIKEKIDGSFLFDSSKFEFIKLETNTNCLIVEATRVHLRNDKIIVYDQISKAVFIFNKDGSYHAKIHNIGQGPGEYPPVVNDFVIMENSVGVFAPVIGKIILYNFDGIFIKDIPLQKTWGDTFFNIDNNLYLINDWSNTKNGSFRFFSLNLDNNKVNKYLSFDYNDNINRGWGLENHYSIHDKKALIIYSTIDTIYESSRNEIIPRYYINITKDKLPRKIAEGDGREALLTAIKENYITGVEKIMETNHFIILVLSNNTYVFYNKTTKECISTKYVYMKDFGNIDLIFSHGSTLENNILINIFNGDMCTGIIKDFSEKLNCKNKDFEFLFKKTINYFESSDENPMLILYRLR